MAHSWSPATPSEEELVIHGTDNQNTPASSRTGIARSGTADERRRARRIYREPRGICHEHAGQCCYGEDRAGSGDLLAVIADVLESHGIVVRQPQKDPNAVTIASRDGGQSILKVSDDAYVRWEFRPSGEAAEGVAILPDLAACLLTGRKSGTGPSGGPVPDGPTLKSRVGRELRRRGLAAAIEVYEDDDMLDVASEVIVSSPAERRARVYVSDDGTLVWERDYWPDHATIRWDPDFSWDLPPLGTLALTITGTIVPAIRARYCGGCGRSLSRYNDPPFCGGCSGSDDRPGQSDARTDDIGARLRYLRNRRGMTLTALAGLDGVSPAYLSMVEHGKRKVDRWSTIVALANALKILPAELALAEITRTADLARAS
jgi:hypothetical protein